MMKLHKFDSYEQYLDTQRRGSTRRANRRPNAREIEVSRIVTYLMGHMLQRDWPCYGMCHGARCGSEVEFFRKKLPKTDVIGTDVAPRKDCVIEWDFQQQKPEWVGHFDFVFSNCVDHASDPPKCIATWLEQLTSEGFLFVQWEPARRLVGAPLPHKGGDCFGADLDEYVQMFHKVGIVRDLIFCGHDKYGMHVVIVVQKRV